VYKFNSAYVHEFDDKSVLFVVTEHTRIEPKNVEDYRELVWTPEIESIKRPVHYVALQGVITTVHSNSGLNCLSGVTNANPLYKIHVRTIAKKAGAGTCACPLGCMMVLGRLKWYLPRI
jgi:hypothetical protein